MRATLLSCALFVVAAGCGDSASPDGGGAADMAGGSQQDLAFPAPDLATAPDLAAPAGDLGAAPDLAKVPGDAAAPDLAKPASDGGAGGSCRDDKDCRLFSSYCETDPCVCFPLLVGTPDPPCKGKMVTCFVDPCEKKRPVCNQKTGLCGVM